MDLLHFVGDIIGNYDVFIGQLVALITLIWADCWKLCRGHQDGISFYYFFFYGRCSHRFYSSFKDLMYISIGLLHNLSCLLA